MNDSAEKDDWHSYLRCTFCGKKAMEVAKLIAGPNVYICDECVALCVDIIADNTAADRE